MAGITGSGMIDVASLVAQLVTAERTPQNNRLLRAEARTNTELSAVGTFRAALSGLRTSLAALERDGSLAARTATSSDPKLFTATAGAAASAGSHTVEVRARASAHKLAADTAFATGVAVGTGTLTVQVGSESFAVTIADGANTLADIRSAINAAPDNKGVQATIINDGTGGRLVLTARDTGEASALRVTASGGDGGLAAFTYDPGVLENMGELAPAADADVRIDGFAITGTTNTIAGAIEGVTLNLLDAEIGREETLTIAADGTAAKSAVDAFVGAYNTLVATIATLSKYDPATRQAGPLNGDAALRSVGGRLRELLGAEVPGLEGKFSHLSQIGVTSRLDGTLAVDAAKLQAALASGDDVLDLFNSESGIRTRVDTLLDSYLGSDGQLDQRTEDLQSRLSDLVDDRAALDRRMTAVEARYRAQFTALDSLMSQLQSTSAFLTQQLGGG